MRDEAEIHADLDVAVPEKMAAPQAWGRWAATQERLAADVPALLVRVQEATAESDNFQRLATDHYHEARTLRAEVRSLRAVVDAVRAALAVHQPTDMICRAIEAALGAAAGVPKPQPQAAVDRCPIHIHGDAGGQCDKPRDHGGDHVDPVAGPVGVAPQTEKRVE